MFLVLVVLLQLQALASAKTYEGVLAKPVVLGGWLWEGNCKSCHGNYGDDHPAADYDDKDELEEAIGNGVCRIAWARRNNGPLGRREIEALADFMSSWEENGKCPDLPELPPQPAREVVSHRSKKEQKAKIPVEPVDTDPLTSDLRKLVESNPVVMGGWLYTRNCYRCHMTYDKGRMGKGIERGSIFRFVSEGKTSTQMTAFSRLRGGELKNKEITAIVDYIKSWENAGEPLAIAQELMTPPDLDPAEFVPIRLSRFKEITGDKKEGETLFRLNCAACHGSTGEGYIGSRLDHGLWSNRPDLYMKSVVKKGITGTVMNSWEKGKRRLSPKEIDDVISFAVELD